MVYLLNLLSMVIFHGYVSHHQMVCHSFFWDDIFVRCPTLVTASKAQLHFIFDAKNISIFWKQKKSMCSLFWRLEHDFLRIGHGNFGFESSFSGATALREHQQICWFIIFVLKWHYPLSCGQPPGVSSSRRKIAWRRYIITMHAPLAICMWSGSVKIGHTSRIQ